MKQPANVPLPDDVRWELARKEAATLRQLHTLKELASIEGVDLPELYGDGYTDAKELSKWSAHWGVTVLESRMQARAYEEARRAVEERKEQALKSWIAGHYRAQHPGRYPYPTEA
jgi:hypothetical protein